MKKLLFSLTLMLVTVTGHTQTLINGIYYNLNYSTRTAEVTKNPNNYTGYVSIPSSVIHDGVSYSVTNIGDYAFNLCNNLTTINIPNSVTKIGNNSFQGCKSLISLTIPKSVRSIGEDAFYYCSALTSIIIDPANSTYDSRNNCNAIIETSTKTLLTGCKNTIIPNNVTAIKKNAFEGCSTLTSIDIPNSVVTIGDRAFRDCTNLSSVTIGNNVTSIHSYAFYGCQALTSITLPYSLNTLKNYAFSNCSSLTSVTVKNPVPITITNRTFSNRANATLLVPAGTKTSYLAADYWKEFKEIKENIPIVSPMLTTRWKQSAPYNNMCPPTTDNGTDHSAAGCGAIAVAQILNKHRVSNHGYGHCTYKNKDNSNITIDVDYSTMSFDWRNILDSYTGNPTTAQANAVASLVFQTGAGMIMTYGEASSPKNMGMMMWGLQHYLHFSPDSRYRNRRYYTTSEWMDMLNNELVNGRPLFYRGTWRYEKQNVGHIFVVDGVNGEGKYHVNFGHGNDQDKYVDLSVINQSNIMDRPGSRAVCYNYEQAMITDFQPMGDIDENRYAQRALILTSPMVLDGDTHKRSATKQLGGSFTLGMKIRDCSLTGGQLDFGLGVFKNGVLKQVIRHNRSNYITINQGGYEVPPTYTFVLPNSLEQFTCGDVNHDNAITVSDVANTIDYILAHHTTNFHRDQADLNNDGDITIADVNGIIERIFNTDSYVTEEDVYDMCFVSSSNGGNKWDPIFENAPTMMKLSVSGKTATITMPENHTLESYLYLREPIREVPNDASSIEQGKAFRLALRNPSSNNFENVLRLVITSYGNTITYDLPNSVYSGCNVDFDILVPSYLIDPDEKNYQVSAFYYEANTNEYLPLTTTIPYIPSPAMRASDIEIFDQQGNLVKHIDAQNVATEYSKTMLQLNPGIYKIRENGKFRVVKR